MGGGEDTCWQETEIDACRTYFHYFSMRLVEQLGRVRALMVFWAMTSADLQSLFQGKLRHMEQKAVRDQEILMMQKLNNREELVRQRNALLESSKRAEATLKEELDNALPSERMKLLELTQAKLIGEMRLAARVQEHIWEWRKVELLETRKVIPSTDNTVTEAAAFSSDSVTIAFQKEGENSTEEVP